MRCNHCHGRGGDGYCGPNMERGDWVTCRKCRGSGKLPDPPAPTASVSSPEVRRSPPRLARPAPIPPEPTPIRPAPIPPEPTPIRPAPPAPTQEPSRFALLEID